MKILQIIGGGEQGGSRNHILTLSKELMKKEINIEIVCFLDDKVAEEARINKVPVTVYSMSNIFDLRALKKVRQHIITNSPDIIHTHGFRGNFMGRFAARGLGIPVITTVHSSIYHDYTHPLKKNFYHRIDKITRGNTRKYIAVSNSLKQELIDSGIQEKKVTKVYNGLEESFYLNKKQEFSIREELGLEDNIFLLTNIGRVENVKNQEMLIRVFAVINECKLPFHGLIVGDGPLLESLQTLAEELKVKDKISFLGFRQDIYDILSDSDLFLLTSKMEGLPITLLEAMATKTPVVLTNVGGMPEVVKLAKNGYVVPVNDVEQFAAKIEEILVQPELRAKLGTNGYEALITNFTTDNFINNTINVYEEVLKESDKR